MSDPKLPEFDNILIRFYRWVEKKDNAPPPGKFSKFLSSLMFSLISPPKNKNFLSMSVYVARLTALCAAWLSIPFMLGDPFGHFAPSTNAAPAIEQSVCTKEVV